jgi:DNA gyrase inhibitor
MNPGQTGEYIRRIHLVCDYLKNGEYAQAWAYMYSEWLPQSGYAPANEACFERCAGGCGEDGKATVDICIPVQVL